MGIRDKIIENLTGKFQPEYLNVIDESDKHRGHAGWIKDTPTHFRVQISSPQLFLMSRVAQHRAIMKALADEFEGNLHALAIEVVDKRVC